MNQKGVGEWRGWNLTGGRRWKKKGQTFEQRDSRIGDVLRGENITFLML